MSTVTQTQNHVKFLIKKTGLASDGVTPVSGYADPGLVIAKVNISEAISRLPHVEIDAYSGSSTYTHKDLRGFLGTAAYVELLRDGAHCRSIIGIISGVTHCGVVGNLNGIPIHRYKFTVDSALINMKYVRRTRSFIGKSAKDVLETMLKNDYGMQYSLCLGCTEVVQTNDTSGQQTIASIQTQMTKALDYYQREESDYDFLLRILAENGLSFRVGTGASASQTSTGGTTSSSGSSPDSAKDSEYEKIFISSGDNYFTTSDDFNKNSGTLSNQEQTVDAKGTSYDYTFDPANGVIKLVNFEMMNCLGVDSVIQAESDRSDSSKREWLLNGSGMALLPSDNEDSQNQMKSVQADYLKRAFIMEQSGWNGVTNSPVVQPGTVINMLDFYGQENSENIKSRVLTMEDVLYEKLPDGYPVSSDASDDISMSFRSLEYGGEDAVTPSASVGELRQSFCRSGSNICMAVVCSNADKDKDAATANTVCTLEAQENKSGMFFYARLDGATNPVRVRFSMPIGGNSQGLYRLPRIGEQIQVTDAGNGNYLLVGYLPGREKMPFANTDGSSDMTKQMTALRHNTIAVIPSYSDDGADKPDPVKYSDLPYSEIGMYSEQGEDYTRIQSAGYRYDHTKKDYISTAENFLFASPSDDTDTISSTNRQFHVLDFEKVQIQAKGTIRFQVGRNYIELNEKSIELHSCSYHDGPGAMDNTLSLNCGGVSIQGIKATIFGQLKASLTSGLCESLSLGNGDIEIAANNLFATTFDKANMTMAMAFGIAESASNLASFIASAVDSANARTYEEIVSGGKIDTKLAYHRMCNEVSSWLTYGSSVTGLMTTAAMVWVMFGGSTVGRYVPQKPLNDKLKTCLTVSSLVLPVWSLLVSLVNYFLGSHSSRRWFMDIGNVICSLFCEIVQIIQMYYVKASDQKANQLSSIGLSEDRMEIWSSLVAANSEKFKIKAVKIPNKDNIGSWDVQLPEPAKFSDSFKSAITWIKEHITPEWKRKFADALTQELKKPKVYMVLDQSQEAWQVETEDADMSLQKNLSFGIKKEKSLLDKQVEKECSIEIEMVELDDLDGDANNISKDNHSSFVQLDDNNLQNSSTNIINDGDKIDNQIKGEFVVESERITQKAKGDITQESQNNNIKSSSVNYNSATIQLK